jgi:hypothetical protein
MRGEEARIEKKEVRIVARDVRIAAILLGHGLRTAGFS